MVLIIEIRLFEALEKLKKIIFIWYFFIIDFKFQNKKVLFISKRRDSYERIK